MVSKLVEEHVLFSSTPMHNVSDAFCFAPDEQLLAIANDDATTRIQDIEYVRIANRLNGHNSRIQYLQFSRSPCDLLSASSDGTIRIWDVELGSESVKYRLKEIHSIYFPSRRMVRFLSSYSVRPTLWAFEKVDLESFWATMTYQIYIVRALFPPDLKKRHSKFGVVCPQSGRLI